MSRPEHLRCVNTRSGIMRINAEQELYDKDPADYERRMREEREVQQQEEQEEREYYANS